MSNRLMLVYRGNVNDAGVRCKDIPLHPLVEKASGENHNHLNPNSEASENVKPAEMKAAVPMVESNRQNLAPLLFAGSCVTRILITQAPENRVLLRAEVPQTKGLDDSFRFHGGVGSKPG